MHWTDIGERIVAGVVVLEVRGHMTLSDSEASLFQYASRLADEGHLHIVLNLQHVAYIDSVGIGEIVRTFLHLGHRGGGMAVCAVSPRTREVLLATRLDTVIHMFDTEEKAVAAVRTLPRVPKLPESP
jgi:stage II sporulation protein AA (anti-sigma F factor antagonist)